MHADTIEAAQWWARPRGPESENWIANYQKSLGTRHRTAIEGIVRGLAPEDLLEVGCHCGPNLVRLGKAFPSLRMLGVDVNADAVEAGRRWVASEGLADRVQINAGRVPEVTESIPTHCCDVVLSCYALAYIAPADLDAVLWEMGRLAAKAVVIAEPMGTGLTRRSISGYSEWAHPYEEASRWIGTLRGMTWTTVPVTPAVDRLAAILVGVRAESNTP